MDKSTDLLVNNSILYRCTQKYYDQQLAQYDVGYGQVVYLIMIYEHEGITMKELAKMGSFDKGTITKAISKLEKLHYVRLEENEKDKRSKLLYTTDQAKELITKIYLVRKEWWEHLNSGLDVESSELFAKVMQEVVDRAQSYMDIESEAVHFFGLQKLSLLDYPGKMACTLFTGGCNMKCPFCHNSELVFLPESMMEINQDDIDQFLDKRKGLLEGICITGGEPLIHPGLKNAIKKMKAKGYKIKLDTNGTYPGYLKELVEEGLVDYVAMDIKNAPAKYALTAGVEQLNLEAIEESMHYLMENHIPYEFRTTIVQEFHEKEDIEAIGQWIKGAQSYFLQSFENNEHVIDNRLHAERKEILEDYKNILLQYVDHVEIRGIE